MTWHRLEQLKSEVNELERRKTKYNQIIRQPQQQQQENQSQQYQMQQ